MQAQIVHSTTFHIRGTVLGQPVFSHEWLTAKRHKSCASKPPGLALVALKEKEKKRIGSCKSQKSKMAQLAL